MRIRQTPSTAIREVLQPLGPLGTATVPSRPPMKTCPRTLDRADSAAVDSYTRLPKVP